MIKKIGIFLLAIFVLSSCSSKYYKNKKNPKRVTYRGQRPSTNTIPKKNTAVVNPKKYHNSEEYYHEIPPAVQVTPSVTQKYIDDYKEIAMVEMQRYKIPASITLAQAILESGSGQGKLARHGNNHFGIKCHSSWQGKTMTHDDDEKGECFRRYKYAFESFEDHSTFLVNRNRYAFLFDLEPDDYVGWAHGLKKAGYATDPGYAKKLIQLIKKHKLYEYDQQVLNPNGNVASTPKTNTPIETSKAEVLVTSTPKPNITEIPKSTENQNKTKYYIVKSGDTLYKIAREQQVSIQQIMKLNNLNEKTSNEIKVGQKLQLN
ncbi:glucosaminidase domain-containing protein [Capnocytophaga cynodegmi]|uniref:Peptidoglycan hydrolase n=1 Tax=Capnocytophaga cynodegmi TaxID=28189 RepID=A0A0B7H495_9FLAO|nr:glucosaminidase domain-containing protein [Capnocytophaga cynodegmi]CEN32458.1 Mannosyl-glycoprotein endo-beta-N-acetylglucosaminidase [Capnocytophaga cynodegmi]